MNLVVKNETGNAKSSITLNYTIHQPPFTHPFVHRLEHDEEGGELWTMRHQTSLRKWKNWLWTPVIDTSELIQTWDAEIDLSDLRTLDRWPRPKMFTLFFHVTLWS